MSGDVQPRRRRDKKRKRDDEDESSTVSMVRGAFTDYSDNLTIHIHKETDTNGHWCARIVFFGLLFVLLGIIGLIIVEHRGTTDVDTPLIASQWATIFEGWIDDVPVLHEEEPESKHTVASQEYKNQDEYKDDYDVSHVNKEDNRILKTNEDKKLEDIYNDEDGDKYSNMDKMVEEKETILFQNNVTFKEEIDASLSLDESNDRENENIRNCNNENEKDSSETTNRIEITDESDDSSERQLNYAFAKKDKAYNDQNSDDVYEDYSEENFDNDREDLGTLEEIEDDINEYDIENKIMKPFNIKLDSIEGIKSTDDESDNINFHEGDIEEFSSISEISGIDDDCLKPLEEIDNEESQEIVNEENYDEIESRQELEEESTNISIKFGIGFALIVTAHFVLVKKWNNDSEIEEQVECVKYSNVECNYEDKEFEDDEKLETDREEDENLENIENINDIILNDNPDKRYRKLSTSIYSYKEQSDGQDKEDKKEEDYDKQDDKILKWKRT